MTHDSALRVLLHAPTADGLKRARANAANLLSVDPDAIVEIVVNADGARAAVEDVHEATSAMTLYCANSLKKQNLEAPEGANIVTAAVLYLAQRQAEGWAYIRA